MSMHCYIGILNDDETVDCVHCHFDGYPKYVGLLLYLHYQDENKIRELISHGSLDSLGMEIGVKHNADEETLRSMGHQFRHQCSFNFRDLEEEMKVFNLHVSHKQLSWEKCYFFSNGKWFFRERNAKKLEDLKELLQSNRYLPQEE